MSAQNHNDPGDRRIVIRKDGPYVVQGDILLVRKTQVVSEYGEPLTWKREDEIETPEKYELCRCGQSEKKPFCDATHALIEFDGTETADTGSTRDRRAAKGGTHIVVRRDYSLCCSSGFCSNRTSNIAKMLPRTADTQVRAQVIAMVERCPSGSYTYSLEAGEPDVEPDLPRQIALTTEITAEGPIAGPLWVTGNIPIERSDGQHWETRNRVTLCSCGSSKNKPLCDGTHRELHKATA
jgi:CDGSH-type Zn-finger protein